MRGSRAEQEGGGKQINVQQKSRLSPEARRVVDEYEAENLEILESAAGTTVKDLTYTQVHSVQDVLNILRAGYGLRQTAAMAQNDVSSRSHTVFTLSLVQCSTDGSSQPITGRLNLVDLAGSERLKKSGSEDVRLREAKSINSSLSTLGKVVMALSQEDVAHVPFRDSKLTRVLKDSLAGNSCTQLLACLHPRAENLEECFNTLQFAVRCSQVMTAPVLNVVGSNNESDAMLQSLKHQVATLADELEFTHAHYQKLLEKVGGTGAIPRRDA